MLCALGLGRRLDAAQGGRWLYRDLQLQAEPGTLTAVVGPNGAGKSTLLRDLVGLTAPMHGTVRLGDRPLGELAPRARARQLAYLPQRPPVPEGLTVRDLVGLGRVPHLGWWSAPGPTDLEATAAALRIADVAAFAERSVTTLSGGELQRVMLARMLATRAPVLVLDEPTTSLDVHHALYLLELLAALARRGHAIVVALHELDLARRFAHAVLLLEGKDGRAHFGRTDQVLTDDRLGRVFQVDVHLADAGLRVDLRPGDRRRIEDAVLALEALPTG